LVREQLGTVEDDDGSAEQAESVLAVIDARKISVSEAERAKIRGSRSRAELETWLARAAVANEAAEIFSSRRVRVSEGSEDEEADAAEDEASEAARTTRA
ncbi:MAG: hypothetical protein ABIP39_03035, partial [Polyangiaceae bacterium]